MLKAIIFDMDGVLVDSEPHHREAETVIFAELGLSVPEEMRRSFVGMSGRKMWETIRECFGLAERVDDLLRFDRERRLAFFSGVRGIHPMPGVVDFLDDIEAHGIKIGLASSSIKELIVLILDALGIRDYFDAVVSGEEVEHGKPAPDIFLRAAELLGAAPAECVVIEDSQNGTRAAKAAGMVCIGFDNPGSERQDLSRADLVVDGFRKLDAGRTGSLIR